MRQCKIQAVLCLLIVSVTKNIVNFGILCYCIKEVTIHLLGTGRGKWTFVLVTVLINQVVIYIVSVVF